MLFSTIIGHDTVKSELLSQVRNEKIPHAQLFISKPGFGALPLALAYASYLMCESPSETDSCGICNACNKTHKFIHPDLHFSFPVSKFGDKKRENTTSEDFLAIWRKALNEQPFMSPPMWFNYIQAGGSIPNINVKECNDIIYKLSLMSYESDKKILIMWLPEYLGNEGNRLLKLIEEPTDNTYLIFVTENKNAILETIISRCRRIQIPAFLSNDIKTYLINKIEINPTQAEQIANMSEGNLSKAIAIAQDTEVDYSELFVEWFRIAYVSDPLEINRWISNVSELSKDDQKAFFAYSIHFIRQIVLSQYLNAQNLNLTSKEIEIANKLSKLLSINKVEKIVNLLNEHIDMIPRNINIKIVLFSDTLTIGSILKEAV